MDPKYTLYSYMDPSGSSKSPCICQGSLEILPKYCRIQVPIQKFLSPTYSPKYTTCVCSCRNIDLVKSAECAMRPWLAAFRRGCRDYVRGVQGGAQKSSGAGQGRMEAWPGTTAAATAAAHHHDRQRRHRHRRRCSRHQQQQQKPPAPGLQHQHCIMSSPGLSIILFCTAG